ncbi:MAG: transglutaminase family protein, partial [Spirochaetales bacterium]|nr:transglutaminase family protein [Spirochaetales bacterium]
NYHPVRADMAHAWVEVFFPEYGWVEFDPTSMNIAPGEEYQFADMDMREVSRLIEEILRNRYQLTEDEGLEETEETELPWYRKTLDSLKRLLAFWYLVVPLLYLAGCFTARCILYVRCYTVKEAGQRTRRFYRRRVFMLRSLGAGRRGNETVWEYALRLDQGYGLSMADLTESYLKALFSLSFEQEDLAAALDRDKEVSQAVRRAFPWTVRVLGFLNPLGIRGRRR